MAKRRVVSNVRKVKKKRKKQKMEWALVPNKEGHYEHKQVPVGNDDWLEVL
jgi:hypothetical protein